MTDQAQGLRALAAKQKAEQAVEPRNAPLQSNPLLDVVIVKPTAHSVRQGCQSIRNALNKPMKHVGLAIVDVDSRTDALRLACAVIKHIPVNDRSRISYIG